MDIVFTEQQALGFAAQAWCDKEVGDRVMDGELAKAFARILKKKVEEALAGKLTLIDFRPADEK